MKEVGKSPLACQTGVGWSRPCCSAHAVCSVEPQPRRRFLSSPQPHCQDLPGSAREGSDCQTHLHARGSGSHAGSAAVILRAGAVALLEAQCLRTTDAKPSCCSCGAWGQEPAAECPCRVSPERLPRAGARKVLSSAVGPVVLCRPARQCACCPTLCMLPHAGKPLPEQGRGPGWNQQCLAAPGPDP